MSYISTNKQSFGSVAKDYKKFRGNYDTKLYKFLLSLLAKKKNEKFSILDLGCGVGNSTEPLLEVAKKTKIQTEVFGCDPDIEMLKEAQKSAKKNKLNIKYLVGSAEKIPFEKEKFDLIFSGAAFHWFANKKAMREVQRVLKKNGVYVVFWTQSINDGQPVIGQELYKKYKWQGIPKEFREVEYVKKFLSKNRFLKVKTIKIPFIEFRTISETIGLMKTNSTYALLSNKDKKEFIKEMTKAYKKALGSKKSVVKQEIRICYGFK